MIALFDGQGYKGTRLQFFCAVVTYNLWVQGLTYVIALFDGQGYKITRLHFSVML